MIHPDPERGINADYYLKYNPQGVVDYLPTPDGPHNPPITEIRGTPGTGPVGMSFIEQAQSRGSLFVYELTGEDSFDKNQEIALN